MTRSYAYRIRDVATTALATILLIASTAITHRAQAQPQTAPLADSVFANLNLRSIGPAFMSGRIADIAIHPQDYNTWYVAVGSGGVWKTNNAGITWQPIFDDQPSYSIGCVTIDPNNPHIVWVGTGENVGGRHVGFGDGVYRSDDGGASWKNMGLPESQHISKIIVHPENSDVVWVAAQGPLWNSGGERGLYMTTDGGTTWTRTLGDDQWTGVTDIVIDPRDPDVLYAATWQRHRTVAAYMGGGPGSGIHKSADGGRTWREVTSGLPSADPDAPVAKIGLAISSQNPDVVYAAIELNRRTGGVYRSSDRGSSWTKMSDAVAGATGPHYYQEIYASPHHFDRLYLVDNTVQISDDGGKSWRRMSNRHKHGDDHAIAFRPDDPDYIVIGSDGGIYESLDHTKSWRFMANLPVTQYYKVALDDAEPFYNVFGGTQDNGSQGGPSRTENIHGISNADWRLVLDWDGHQPATEPGNPNIMYAERQQGALSRIDMITGETMDIQPQPGAGERHERFNWDAPILVSPHDPARLYFASHRLWRSDNRGDAWTAVSPDLTRNIEPITLPIMGRTQSWDNAWDINAMSDYSTITSVSESPLVEGVLYVGTDDGMIQVSEDGGANWRAVELGGTSGSGRRAAPMFPGLPASAFVNDIKADLHDSNTVYAAFDNHKFGDLQPYLYRSTDRGRTWLSVVGNLPERTLVWRVVQDHVNPNLLFVGTEFGIYFTVDGAAESPTWMKLGGGVPTISFRDLAIHRRENDLVGASFGRGFYILDDYSALRDVSAELIQAATLFAPRDAWWYMPRGVLSFDDEKGSQGDAYFMAPNPPFGAVFTYYLPTSTADQLAKKSAARQKAEAAIGANADVPFPGWEALEVETRQDDGRIWLTVRNGDEVVRRVAGKTSAGFHRVAWDLKHPAPGVIRPSSVAGSQAASEAASQAAASGLLVAPGRYSVTLSQEVDGVTADLSGPFTFEVKPLRQGALRGADHDAVAAFWRSFEDAQGQSSALQTALGEAIGKTKAMQVALARANASPGDLDAQLHTIRTALLDLDTRLNGPAAKRQIGARSMPTVGSRLSTIQIGVARSTYGPTQTHREQLEIALNELGIFGAELNELRRDISSLAERLVAAGAPWVEGEW